MSLRRLARLVQKLRHRFRRPPRTASDLIRDYSEYLRLQRDVHRSHESEVERWAEGQRRFVRDALSELPRDARILDCACGDGVGLAAARDLGFLRLIGVDLAPAKAARARALGFQVEERDMHDLAVFTDGSFDAIVSSHTLEHAYAPARVLSELRRVLAARGLLFVVLPYPDTSPRNELAHPGKYELGTDRRDGGASVTRFFEERGFQTLSRRLDTWREPEIWLSLEKVGE